jgi:TPR repeat protein
MFGRRREQSSATASEFAPVVLLSEAAARQAAADGSPAEMNRLGVLLKAHGHQDEAAEWFRDSAHAGNVDAMANLAICLMAQGRNAEAAEWFRRTGAPLGETLADRLMETAERDSAGDLPRH